MRVEFLLTNIMEVGHMAPIAKALVGKGVSVTMAPAHNRHLPTEFGWSDMDAVVSGLEREGFKATGPDKTADVVIATFPIQNLKPFYKDALTVRMQYGVGLVDPKSDHPMGGESDYYLVHGPFGVRTQFTMHGMPSPLIPWERVKVIGYPRLDRFYSTQKIRNSKPALLWLPTWSVRSSIDRYLPAIKRLGSNVWIRPHHCTERWEPERMRALVDSGFFIVPKEISTAALYAASDLILADLSSGAFAEALLIGKPVIGLTNPEEHGRALIDLTYLPTVTDPEYLGDVIETLRRDWRDPHFATLRAELFTTTKGNDGMVAARAILECMQQ